MRLRSLRIQGLRTFVDVTINFPETGLMLIKGDSGVGKSSIFLALAYVFDILPPGFSATSLQRWDGTPLQVDLEAEENGVDIRMGRGKKTYIQVGETVTGGASAVAELRPKMLGLAPDIFRALTYRAQKQPGPLLAMTDSGKKEFLTAVLGLGGLEEVISAAEDRIRDLKPRRETAFNQCRLAISDLQQLEKEPVEVRTATDDLRGQKELEGKALESARARLQGVLGDSAVAVARTKQDFEAADASLQDIKAGIQTQISAESRELEQKLEKCRRFLQKVKSDDDLRSRQHKEDIRGRNAVIQELELKLQDARRQASCLPELMKTHRALEARLCQTCMRPWDQTGAEMTKTLELIRRSQASQDLIPELERDILGNRTRLQELTWVPDPNVEKLTVAREAIYAELQTIGVRIGSSEALKAAEDIRRQKYQDHYQAQQESVDVRMAKKDVDECRFRLRDIENKIEVAEARNLSADRLNQQRENRLQTMKARLLGLENELETLTQTLNSELDFVDCLGRTGFLGVIFDDILREISAAANTRMARLQNTAGITVEFRMETLTQKGKVNKTISTVFNVDGNECGFETGLSGGQQTSAEQALDLAVAEVIQARSGKMPEFLIYDEPFHGMPLQVKEASMEILRETAQQKLVMVVDHENSFQEHFSVVLSVQNSNGASTVIQ